MENRRLIVIGILVFVFAETGSTPMFGRAPFPGDFTEGTEFTRPKREGTNAGLSHGERLQDPRREGLSRVKRIDTEQTSRIKRETRPVSPTDDRREVLISKRKEITEQHEDWQDAKANRKRMDRRMNMHRETEDQQTRGMTSFPRSSKDIRWQKFERDVSKTMPRPFR